MRDKLPIFHGLICCVVLLASPAVAQLLPAPANDPSVIFVDADAGGANDGSSWADAFVDLQDALSAARTNPDIEEIWVSEGMYHPAPPSGDRAISFDLVTGDGVYGGFAGWETQREQRDWVANVTTLSGDLNDNDTPGFGHNGENSYHVVMADDVNEETILDGFVVTGGNANGLSPNRNGAGILSSGSLLVRNCVIKANRAVYFGAGGHFSGGNPEIVDCEICDNWANAGGGGLFLGGAMSLDNCMIRDNSGISTGGGGIYGYGTLALNRCVLQSNHTHWNGGGIDISSSGSLSLTDCEFISNSADRLGGGLYIRRTPATLARCGFYGNSAALGGGIRLLGDDWDTTILMDCIFYSNVSSAVYVTDNDPAYIGCVFEDNQAAMNDNGGGAYHLDSDPTFHQCAFIGNSTLRNGGGAFTENGDAVFDSCDFARNYASWNGGGVFGSECDTTLYGCNFSDNVASGGGGAIYDYEGTLRVTNCLLTDNTADKGGAVWNSRSLSLVNCLIVGNSAASDWGAGGGLYSRLEAEPGQTNIVNCTIADNRALNGYGGGMFAGNSNEALANNILWGNADRDGIDESAQIHRTTDLIDIDYCCVQGLSGALGGTGNIGDEPGFTAPGYWFDNGTPYDYSDDIWIDGDYRPLSGSPCADAGDNTAVLADFADLDDDGDLAERTPLDIDGGFRFTDDPLADDTGVADPPSYPDIVDMGAYEFRSCLGDLDGDGAVGLDDLAQLLASFGVTSGAAYQQGDLDGDGDVDLADLATFLPLFGGTCE